VYTLNKLKHLTLPADNKPACECLVKVRKREQKCEGKKKVRVFDSYLLSASANLSPELEMLVLLAPPSKWPYANVAQVASAKGKAKEKESENPEDASERYA